MNIALLGGSFNPPHVGHLMAALYVRATLGFERVWLVPTYRHPFGKPAEAFEHRVQMCRVMAEDLGPWLEVKEFEKELGGEGRTVDLLEHLVRSFPTDRFGLVIGSDILKDLPNWKDVERVRRLARMVVLNRAGHEASAAVGPPLAMVSSTDVRQRLAGGERPSDVVPSRVLDYAQRHHLYGL